MPASVDRLGAKCTSQKICGFLAKYFANKIYGLIKLYFIEIESILTKCL